MVRFGDGEGGFGAHGDIVDQAGVVAGLDPARHLGVEAPGPRVRVQRTRIEQAQVVDDVAAAQDQDTLVAQTRQGLADLVMFGRAAAKVETELQHRDVGLGIEEFEDAPGPVIQAPAVQVGAGAEGGEPGLQRLGQGRIAGRGVGDLIQGLRKAVEIMDCTRRFRGCYQHALGLPVRGNAEDGAGAGQPFAERGPGSRQVVVLQGVHRRAVADEKGGHSGGHGDGRAPGFAAYVGAPTAARHQLRSMRAA